MKLILNELSIINEKFSNQYVAKSKMEEFTLLCKEAVTKGNERRMLTTINIATEELSENYTFFTWLQDKEVPKESKAYIRSLITRSQKFPEDEYSIQKQLLDFDFTHSGERSSGLGLAHLTNGLALSLNTSSYWCTHKLEIEKSFIDSESGELDVEEVVVVHASNTSHLSSHNEWYITSKKLLCSSGLNLWERREEIFPNLIFCENSRIHIKDLLSRNELLSSVVDKLFDLEIYSTSWDGSGFYPNEIRGKITPDSPATLKRFAKERTFTFPDGRDTVFSWHSRVTPGAWRIFFYPDPSTQKIIIGHIGPKLPTVTDP